MKTPYGWNVCTWYQAPVWKNRQALALLQPDRWMNFSWDNRGITQAGYVPMVYGATDQSESALEALRQYPEHTWLMMNEPNIQEQANLKPSQAVDLVIWWIALAREAGVSMNWCGPNSSINWTDDATGVNGAEWWREFLRELRRAGIPGPSFDGVHMYRGATRQQVRQSWSMLTSDWRHNWLGSRPMIITEVCAENEPFERQAEVMDECFDLLKLGREQGPHGRDGALGVYWFAAAHHQMSFGNWPNCALTEEDPERPGTMRLTRLGQHWKSLQAKLA